VRVIPSFVAEWALLVIVIFGSIGDAGVDATIVVLRFDA
jgi:hypothetical protein